ncbi:unnamed protein product [Schistosoma margrebowiei]|uniref:Uncharacterized protein n=1 Tax=Schistosoma margrebowiei TaxID=48269 RepID=A0A183MRD9_9TREM|nr:unnamed protein product [Schistosoma margrebowiei]
MDSHRYSAAFPDEMSLQDNCGVQEVRTSHRGDCFLLLPSGERVSVQYMNGLQILGFSFAFFGLASAFLGSLYLYLTITGLLDSVLIPSLSPNDSNNYPVEFSLAGGYGLPIYTGVLDVGVFRCSENHLHEDDSHEILVSGDKRLTIGKLYILDESSMKAR